jgi:hypothetical protein
MGEIIAKGGRGEVERAVDKSGEGVKTEDGGVEEQT